MLEVLNLKDFDKVYNLMEVSFPRDEYRNYEDQKALLSDSSYIIYVVYDETRGIKAFMAVWDFDEYAFIEHFAVSPKFRNNGIGKEMLSQIAKVLGKRMCLEVEEPDTNMAKRRIGFMRETISSLISIPIYNQHYQRKESLLTFYYDYRAGLMRRLS